MSSFALLNAFLALLIATTQVVAQKCACGYRDSSGHVWRESIVSDFTQAGGALAAVDANWIISTDLQKHSGTATADIQYVANNVIEFQDALGLKASAYDNKGSVKSAEIFTQRSDILFGSFRMQAQVPRVPGVVFGFFTYISDTQEQDIEFLSSDVDYYQHLYYTNQPGQLPNSDPDPDAAKDVVVPGADFTTFGIHRFDWLPAATTYSYAGSNNGTSITSTTAVKKHVPNTPSEFVLNVWSNGDPQFSKGPPKADALATVHYVHLYFNSTTFSATAFASACRAAGNVAPCTV
ncbi:concanavalin A-like lectin/glucanase domain-containing protein [Mycena rebaudengoi]|nr:concanavalin A-like lectin/glucanase domain-containing protein [Mycena rebaudengoi]